MKKEFIEAHVKAVNRRNTEIFKIIPDVFTAITPFLGQKIELATGGLTKKVVSALPALPSNTSLQSYYNTSHGYSLKVNVRTCESVAGNCGCVYSEAVIYIGDLSNGILTKIYEQPNPKHWPVNYTVEQVEILEEGIRHHERELSDFRSRYQAIIG